MATTNTYLTFNGNCEEAFNFYKAAFRVDFSYIGRFGEMPDSGEYKIPDADKNKVMHVSLPIGKSILMGSDCGSDWAPSFRQGNNFSVSITAESKAEAEQLFNALAEDGTVTMPLAKTFWSEYFGMLTDKFGINWMMSYDR